MSAEAEAIVTTGGVDAAPEKTANEPVAADTTPDKVPSDVALNPEQIREEKILKGKELFSQGSRNFLVKSYDEAADELSQVCQLYEEVYGELADELGQPLLLYAKALIAMALDENKVIDVPDEAADDDEDEEADEDEDEEGEANKDEPATAKANGDSNGKKLDTIKEGIADEADSTGDADRAKSDDADGSKPPTAVDEVSSSNSNSAASNPEDERPSTSNGEVTPSTSNGAPGSMDVDQPEEENEDGEGVSGSLQLAWEILEAAAKIFSRQGLSGLPYLADVQTELANIEFENGILDSARDDYDKALKIHAELPNRNRRALAELHYKIGLTHLMQQQNKEGAGALRNSSVLIEEEIAEIKKKENPTERDKSNMLDLEETRQEILVKIQEIEETQAQTIAEVRAALDSYIKPMSSSSSSNAGGDAAASSSTAATVADGAAAANGAPSSSSSAATSAASSSAISSSSAKPTDITHLIKRKKPEEPSSEAEALCSPAKRAAV
ncbi:protein NASP homolog [Drosophila hydei]|uniref:Protein NASP homolog n=1 Tax=Drosophila hydei TaxID=7224 RepID=A0A6J1M9I4_DROHY|nr:protein NASP homolog [Drosophila hydei]